MTRLKSCFSSVVLSLEREGEERACAKAIELLRLVIEYRFICTMLLMCDALPCVSRLSRCFQLTDSDYSIIPKMLKVTVESLEQLKTSDGINLRGMQQFLDQLRDAGIELQRKITSLMIISLIVLKFLFCLI